MLKMIVFLASFIILFGVGLFLYMWLDTHVTKNKIERRKAEAELVKAEAALIKERRLLGEVKSGD